MSEYIIEKAKTDKNRARRYRKAGKLADAERLLRESIRFLQETLDQISQDESSQTEADIARELSDCYGSLGGVLRSAGRYAESMQAYDAGEALESSERYGIVNSYNLVQRLVARVLLRPDLVWAEPWFVGNEDLPTALGRAEEIIKGQMSVRVDDPWILADQALVRLLLLRTEASEQESWKKFRETASFSFAVDSTLRTVEDMLKEMEAVRSTVENPRFQGVRHRLEAVLKGLGSAP